MSKKAAQTPCKDCQKRYIGCHDICEKYQTWHKRRQEYLEARHAQNRENNAIFESHRNRRMRMGANKLSERVLRQKKRDV